MIVLGFLNLLWGGLSAVIGALPNPAAPGLNDFATTVVGDSWFGHLAWANNYFPLDQVLLAAAAVWTMWGVMWVFRLSIALLVKLHVLGGGDK